MLERYSLMNDLVKFCKLSMLAVVVVLNVGCSFGGEKTSLNASLYLGFFSPQYLDVWIETANVTDVGGNLFSSAMTGNAAVQSGPDDIGAPVRWPTGLVWGKGRNVDGAGIPKSVYVRWQSRAEPQTYEAHIEIPESTQSLMAVTKRTYCPGLNTWEIDRKRGLIIGLAPRGIVKVWVSSVCSGSVEVVRIKGTVVQAGPFAGHANAAYVDLPSKSRAYIDKFGIPAGQW